MKNFASCANISLFKLIKYFYTFYFNSSPSQIFSFHSVINISQTFNELISEN